MRVPHFFVMFIGLLAMCLFFGCSRESSIKENVNLKNNHSRVFVFNKPIEDAKAFADSMANTQANPADSIPDTLTVTINDTVYLIGLLPYNVDKIYRFQWGLKYGDKDTTVIGNNATPLAWTFSKTGVYYPLFVAIDGNNATDTAGTATKRSYIRVIDTKPDLTVPKDTLWTSHNGTITFPILASDSFGTITSIKVDLDASGKDSAQIWKYETFEDNDSLYITIKHDPTKIDSLGNQKIYVIATDDDQNETLDSVNLHFNRVPRLKVIYPLDDTRHNIADRFYFLYEGEDDDNPQDLKYFIYAQTSKNGQPPQKAFTTDDLIAEEFTSNIFEPINKDGKNVITLINNPGVELTGRIYWDMYVTDGYDIVRLNRIESDDKSSRPWKFYIGDLSSTQGIFSGTALFQGRDTHDGIRVEFNNGNKIFEAITDSKGNYSVKVDAGDYTITAKADSAKEYQSVTIKDLFVESGYTFKVDSIVLKDTVKPMLLVKNIDTLAIRTLDQSIYARDLGSFLDTVTASIDGNTQKLDCSKIDGNAVQNCPLVLENLEDGTHSLTYTAKDKAGNVTTLKQNIFVNATSISLDVNGSQKDKIAIGEVLTFTAKISGAYPAPDTVSWIYDISGTPITKKSPVSKEGEASFQLAYETISGIDPDKDYVMTAAYTNNGANVKAQVKFGIRSDKPTVIFLEPGFETIVSKNDPIHFKVVTYKGKDNKEITLSWDCGKGISSGYSCPASSETEVDLAFDVIGNHSVIAKVTDGTLWGYDTVIVQVISAPPTIKATRESNTNEFKINSKVPVKVSASDKYGTIQQIQWGCSNGNVSFDNDTTFATPQKSVSDIAITVQLPGTEVKNHKCVFAAIDDDGEQGLDTLLFNTLLDPPTVHLSTKRDTVKINSNQQIKANANDKLGFITQYEIACSDNLNELKTPQWDLMSGATTTVKMPSTATNAYYCVVQVTDDDGNTAKDTATYKVIVGLPTATAYVNYNKVTIKDVVELNAHAQDSLGTIVKYEWGCGSARAENIGFTYSSPNTPRTTMTMPAIAQNGYQCIVRVTDDDGNTARDTVKIDIILAPPTIEVATKSLIVREGYNIALNANASDNNNLPSDPGEIVKREWSCGAPSQIESNWKTVSSFDTLWKAPAPHVPFYCVARATDNDGNMVSDSINITFSTDVPKIWVKDEIIYVNPGDGFSLNASINDVWQGINWFTWNCIDKESGKSLEKTESKYDYVLNGKSFEIGKDSSYSEQGKNMLCIVAAEEKSTKATFKDTTEVRILKMHPQGVITAADTVYLWSGDESVDDEALYFYTKEWGGFNSKLGELGKKESMDFWWKFSNVDGNFYQGNKDGSLDTSIAEFNTAFIRKTMEGSMTIYLDFRDSTATTPSLGFYSRHRAEEVSRKVYFRKAWENLGKDTVIAPTSENISPVLEMVNDKPFIAYASASNSVTVASLNGSAWANVGSVTVAGGVSSLQMSSDGKDLYLGILDKSGNYNVYKSASATSALAKVGSTLTGITSGKILCRGTNPLLVYLKSSSIMAAELNSSTWQNKITFPNTIVSGRNTTTIYYREVNAIVNANKELLIIGIASDYKGHFATYNTSNQIVNGRTELAPDMSKLSLAVDGSIVYVGFANRDVEKYGPYAYKGSWNSNRISWDKSGAFSKPIFEGMLANNISLKAHNGNLYAAIDDNGRPTLSQVHVFKLGKDKWHFYGENQLPYFNTVFYDRNRYYLRGSSPMLAVDGAGKVYLSLLARENAGGQNRNNGPLVMKYVADNWEIH